MFGSKGHKARPNMTSLLTTHEIIFFKLNKESNMFCFRCLFLKIKHQISYYNMRHQQDGN
uniref:Uncharacterized protein n=1 Tax=Arundo donax TaxID=35708 RepID=A0A0A9DYB5_ARUDO